MENFTDAQLVAEYLKGEKEALEILISRYLKQIYNFVYRLIDNPGDAEDLSQEIFTKVWHHLKKFDQTKNFKTWIFKIAQNTCFDFYRKKKTIPFSDFDRENGENTITETIADPSPLPDDFFDQENLAEKLAAAMSKLSPKNRAVLLLHYNGYLTFQEISESLNEPLNTVKSRHRRAIIALKKILVEN